MPTWCCTAHGRLIDADENQFPVELLRKWKRQAEEASAQALFRLERIAAPASPEDLDDEERSRLARLGFTPREDLAAVTARLRAIRSSAGELLLDQAWRTAGVRDLVAIPLYLTTLLTHSDGGHLPTTKEEVFRLFLDEHERSGEKADADALYAATLAGTRTNVSDNNDQYSDRAAAGAAGAAGNRVTVSLALKPLI